MSDYIPYIIIGVALIGLEMLYFRLADHFNIIDKPNERSSHSTIVLRGGGIIFLFGAWLWSAFFGFQYPWFLLGLTMLCCISFIDDIRSLPDSIRLVAQFIAVILLFIDLEVMLWQYWWVILLALIVCVGIINAYNFMDGINGITGGYSLAVGIAFILLLPIGKLIWLTGDISYIILLAIYGVDSVLTICHRIILHENLGQAHRKHAFQIMTNELHIPHEMVSLAYAVTQMIISIGFIFIPQQAHWFYLLTTLILLSALYVWFKHKYYHLHEEYLNTLHNK